MRHGPLLWTEVYLGHYYVLNLQPVQILVFFVHGISTDASLIKKKTFQKNSVVKIFIIFLRQPSRAVVHV